MEDAHFSSGLKPPSSKGLSKALTRSQFYVCLENISITSLQLIDLVLKINGWKMQFNFGKANF